MRGADLGGHPEVAHVAHQQDARDRLEGTAAAGEGGIELVAPPARVRGGLEREPPGRRVQLHLGQVDAAPAEVLVGIELQLLVDRGDAADHDLAVLARREAMAATRSVEMRGRLEHLERLERDGQLRLRVVVGVDRTDVGLALVPVEPVDVVLARLVQVDRVLVDIGPRREQVDLAEDARPVGPVVDDEDVLGGRRPEADLRRREVLARPVPALVVREPHVALLGEEREEVVRRRAAEGLASRERQLERRGPEVRQEDVDVLGVEARLLRGAVEEVLGMARHEPVDGARARDEDRDADVPAAPGAAHLLPRRGDRAGIAGQDRGVEAPDVDPELERVRRDDAEDVARPQPGLDRPPLVRQVAAAVPAHALVLAASFAHRFAQRREQQLDRDPRAAEDDRLAAGAQERQRRPMREPVGSGPDTRALVERGRVEDDDVPLALGRAGTVDDAERPAGQRLRQVAGIPDRRRAADDPRGRAVVRAEAHETAQDVRDVAAEDAAVRVRLVDDDEAELLEQLEPLRVVRQDRRVKHVRVRHHDLARLADEAADRRRRVPVVDARGEVHAGVAGEVAELGELVLAQGLRREQVERPRRRVLADRLEDRQVVAERLARRGRRHDRDVLARHGAPRAPRPGGGTAPRCRASEAHPRGAGAASRGGERARPPGPG